MNTLAGLVKQHAGYDMLSPRQQPFSGTEARGWSGPGTADQWPSLQGMDWRGGSNTQAGEWVTEANAMKYADVYSSVRILSGVDASLPCHIYRRREAGGQDKAIDDYRYYLLHDQPNPEMPAALFRLYMRQNRCLWGNAYGLLTWNRAMRLESIYPLRPDWMEVARTRAGQKVYHYNPPDGLRAGYYSDSEILHFRGMGDDLVGFSPIRLARQGIGLGMAAETFGSAFFKNGARMSGILEVQGRLKDAEATSDKFNEKYAGAANAGKILTIDQGSKFVSTTIPPEDAQYIETRMFQGGEISAKIYGVPPNLSGHTEKQTSWGTGVEQMSIGFVTYTIMPDCVLMESEINSKILSGGLYAKFSIDALLRADAKSRAESLQIARRNGIINANEWRELDERNPYDGGDEYVIEANMQPVSMLGKVPPQPAPGGAQ